MREDGEQGNFDLMVMDSLFEEPLVHVYVAHLFLNGPAVQSKRKTRKKIQPKLPR